MPFKRKKPKSSSTRNWTHRIAPKNLQENHFDDLFKIGLDTSKAGENASGKECLEGDISLEEYSKKRENKLIKYNLNCSCDDLAGGIIDDQGAMHIAHVMLTSDFLESVADWMRREEAERKMAEHFHAQTGHRGYAAVDYIRWEKAKNDKAVFGKMVNEAIRELLAFETLNKDLFCSMTIGETPDEKQRWRDLKLIRL